MDCIVHGATTTRTLLSNFHFQFKCIISYICILCNIYLYIIYNFMFIYIYFFLLCLFSPSFCIAIIPSERERKGSLIVTKKLLRIIAKGTEQFTHKMFSFSSMIVTM